MRHAHCLSARSFYQEVRHPDFLVGEAVLDDQAVDVGDLVAKLQATSKNNPDRRIFVRGDKDLASVEAYLESKSK